MPQLIDTPAGPSSNHASLPHSFQFKSQTNSTTKLNATSSTQQQQQQQHHKVRQDDVIQHMMNHQVQQLSTASKSPSLVSTLYNSHVNQSSSALQTQSTLTTHLHEPIVEKTQTSLRIGQLLKSMPLTAPAPAPAPVAHAAVANANSTPAPTAFLFPTPAQVAVFENANHVVPFSSNANYYPYQTMHQPQYPSPTPAPQDLFFGLPAVAPTKAPEFGAIIPAVNTVPVYNRNDYIPYGGRMAMSLPRVYQQQQLQQQRPTPQPQQQPQQPIMQMKPGRFNSNNQ